MSRIQQTQLATQTRAQSSGIGYFFVRMPERHARRQPVPDLLLQNLELGKPALGLSIPHQLFHHHRPSFALLLPAEPHPEPAARLVRPERDECDAPERRGRKGEKELGLDPRRAVEPGFLDIISSVPNSAASLLYHRHLSQNSMVMLGTVAKGGGVKVRGTGRSRLATSFPSSLGVPLLAGV